MQILRITAKGGWLFSGALFQMPRPLQGFQSRVGKGILVSAPNPTANLPCLGPSHTLHLPQKGPPPPALLQHPRTPTHSLTSDQQEVTCSPSLQGCGEELGIPVLGREAKDKG